jgi:hypothetical protein
MDQGVNEHGAGVFRDSSDIAFCDTVLMMGVNTAET